MTDSFKDDIRCVELSEYHCVVATGSAYGVVMLWDFEMLKLISVLNQHSACVKAINIIDEYPLMITFSLDGTINVFSIRGGNDRTKSTFMGAFVNISKMDGLKPIAVPVTCA